MADGTSGERKWLVETAWLAERLSAPDIVVLDGTMHLPTAGRDARTEVLDGHIPGALFFDIDEISDRKSSLPHMLPPATEFASHMRKLGIGDGSHVIVYDTLGLYSAARVWWMFRTMGHADVAVLDGGFNAWREAGGAVEDLPPHVMADRHFTVRPRQDLVRSLEQMKDLVGGAAQVVDARSGPRFRGEIEEPRPGLRRGHMPGALNVYYGDLIGADGRLKPEPEMRAIFEKASVDLARPIVNTCGSGVTAAILALAQSMLGRDDAAVYDGSWAEWGAPKSGGAVETG